MAGKSLHTIKLEQRAKKSKKDNIITDMDYVLRDKKDDKDSKNFIDITPKATTPKAKKAS
jgi:hypothetical protein